MTASANGILAASALPASCGSDIKVRGGEIVWENGECLLAEGVECLIQNLMSRLGTERGTLFYAPDFGEGLLRFLHSPTDERTLLEVESLLVKTLRSTPGVEADSETVKVFSEGGKISANLIFTVAQEEVRLRLTLGEALEWEQIGVSNAI